VSVPGPGIATSVARYWSPYAWRPTTMGRVQPETRRGTLAMMMGSERERRGSVRVREGGKARDESEERG